MSDSNTLPWLYSDTFLHPYRTRAAGARRRNSTGVHYERHLRYLAQWVQEEERDGYDEESMWPLDPAQLTFESVRDYCDWLANYKSWSTARTYMAGIIQYLRHLETIGALPDGLSIGRVRNYVRQRGQHENVQASRRVLSQDDLRMRKVPEMVHYYDTLPLPDPGESDFNQHLSLLRNRAIMQTLYATGMRISELVSLNVGDIEPGASYVVISGKRKKQRAIHLRDYVHDSLSAYQQARGARSGPMFVSHSRNSEGRRLTTTSVHRVVKKAARAVDAGRLSAHDIRHFRATQLLRRGMPLEVVQEFLGHENIATTRDIYAPVLGAAAVREWLDRVDDPDLQAALARHREEWQQWQAAEGPLPSLELK